MKQSLSFNNYFRHLPLLLILILFYRCEDEKPVERNYPRISGTAVTNISDSGAIFSANLYSLGNAAITEYGFLWGNTSELTYTWSNRIVLGIPKNPGSYSAEIRSALIKDISYNVRPYVKTEEKIIYGPLVKFHSLGSKAPVISSVEPDSVFWLDTLNIYGKYFSYITGDNTVKINDITCSILSSTDTSIRVLVSGMVFNPLSEVKVELAGNVSNTDKKIKIILPKLKNVSKTEITWRDTLLIDGRFFFENPIYKKNLSAKIGGVVCDVIKYSNDSIWIKVNDNINKIENKLEVIFNGCPVAFRQDLILKPVAITEVKPLNGAWGSYITVYGRFHPIQVKNTIFLDNILSEITYFTKDSLRFRIPNTLTKRMNAIKLNVSPFSIVVKDSIQLQPPIINSFTPVSGFPYDLVVLNGNYLHNGYVNTKVWIGNKECSIYSFTDQINESWVRFWVPTMPSGNYNIYVQTGDQKVSSSSLFSVTKPAVFSVSPLSATFNEEITFEGENLYTGSQNETRVYFGSAYQPPAEIKSITNNRIVVLVPSSIDSICKIFMEVKSGGINIPQPFVLKPPELINTEPGEISAGDIDLKINGSGFNPVLAMNKVSWEQYPLKVKSCTPNSLVVSLPPILPKNSANIVLNMNGYTRKLQLTNKTISDYSLINIPKNLTFSLLSDNKGLIFNLKGKLYLSNFFDGKLISFDPVSKSFIDNGNTGISQMYGLSYFSLRDTLFILHTYNKTINYLTGVNDSWKTLGPNLPINYSSVTDGAMFCLNNEIYYGLPVVDYTQNNIQRIWKFRRSSNSWIEMERLPNSLTAKVVTYFSINNIGYVLFEDNKFCKYDPLKNTWTQLSNFPSTKPATGRVSMVIKNKAYVGLGSESYLNYVDVIYQFDPVSETWSFHSKIPLAARYPCTATVVNDVGYIGPGKIVFMGSQYYMNDIIQFDPENTLK